MFKNIIAVKFNPEWNPDLAAVEDALNAHRFVACGASQEKSAGWVEPRGEKFGPLIESVAGQWIMKLQVESKVLPSSVVKDEAEKRIEQIQIETGRKPGKKEIKEIREDMRAQLLVRSFTKKSASFVWFDRETRMLVVEAGSQSHADAVISMLIQTFDGLAVALIETAQSPSGSMSIWLNTQEPPQYFTADRDCMLKASDESKASIKYAHHPLDIDEIRVHIENGKMPTQLAMTWQSKVSFVLTDGGAIKKISFVDVSVDESTTNKAESGFDADVAISTGALREMIPDLIAALGGAKEIAIPGETAAPTAAHRAVPVAELVD